MTSVQAELESALQQAVKDGKIPQAIVYATNRDGSFQYHYATGYQHFGVNDEPIREDAVLMLASQTKLLTSIAILQIVEKGYIGLDDDTKRHIPELTMHGILKGFDKEDKPIIEPITKPVTLRHLLTHTSGAAYGALPDLYKWKKYRGLWWEGVDIAGPLVARYNQPTLFQPGESYMYGPNLDWACLLLHRITGLDLEAWFQKYICAPLDIHGITFWPNRDPALKEAVVGIAKRTDEGKLIANTEHTINSRSDDAFGGHGCYARLSDYIKVQHSLLANDSKLLTPASVDLLFTPQLQPAPRAALQHFAVAFESQLPGEYNPAIPLDHGLGGVLFMETDAGRRKKGTLQWAGMTNPFWLIDREAGLALTVGFQVLPNGDRGCKEMITVVEKAVYKMAGVKFD